MSGLLDGLVDAHAGYGFRGPMWETIELCEGSGPWLDIVDELEASGW